MSVREQWLPEDEYRPLSGAQEGLWYAQRLAPDGAAYNTGEAVEVHGPLDTVLFETALRRTVGEAGTFALRFLETDNGPRCQSVTDDWPLHRVDVSTVNDPEAAAWERIRADLATPVDTDKGPLFSHALFTLAADRHIWLLRAHHILLDGYSYKLLGRRLAETYNALADGREPPASAFAPVSGLQADEAAYLSSERCARDRQYWSDRLAALPEPTRLTGRTAPPRAPFLRCTAELAVSEVEELSAAARLLDITRTELIAVAVAAFLHRMTGAEDLVLGMATMSRLGGAALRTPGTTSDVLPLRVSARPDTTVADLARGVAADLAALRRHQQYRGEFIRRDLGLLGTGRRLYGPVLNIIPFTEELTFAGSPARWHHLSGGAVDDLQINVRPGTRTGELWLSFDANPDLYEQDDLVLHRDRFLALLREIVRGAPATPLHALDLLLPGDHPRDRPERSFPVTATLTQMFERQARARPGQVAVTCAGERLTYGELDAGANRLARLLIERGAGPGRVVAVALHRGLRLVPALLAVLKTGAAYLPLDPGHPAERLRLVMDDTGPVLLVTETGLAADPPGDVPAVLLDDPVVEADVATRPDGILTDAERAGSVSPADIAYIIHTSGSTGLPKGVPVAHANVVRLFAATAEHFDFGAGDVWTLFHSFAFDFSVWEIWGALLHGGRLVVVPYAVSRSPREFLRLLHDDGVTVLNQTPSAFEQLMDADQAQPQGPSAGALRYVIFGGEALRPQRLRPWVARHGLDRPALVNMYGITETTVHVTYHRLTRSDVEVGRRGSDIGTPLADLSVYLLDGMRPVATGAIGEMCVAGAGVTAGYLNRPELTAERFPDDPFGPAGSRMYRSGDLARRHADGSLEYLGRLDEQVQLRGFRVEPGEIETVLARHPSVSRAAVVLRRAENGTQQLVAYTVPAGDRAVSSAELRAHAATYLPDYMVPTACVSVATLPLTVNGKLDTGSLPAPDFTEATAGARPASAAQRLVCGLFEDVLKLHRDTVGVAANFFDLGGDSLLATRLLARLRQETGAEVPITALFDGPTPAALAELVDDRAGTATERPEIGKAVRPHRVPLSYAQERMWFLNRLEDSAGTYNIPLPVPIGSAVDTDALRAALGDVADRHESLRTVFADHEGVPYQRIMAVGQLRPELRCIDCPPEEIGAYVAAASRYRFDLATESPLRAWVFATGDDRVLLLLLHHSAADGWSLRPFADDLSAAYAARRAGAAPIWTAAPVQYADYALWQRAVLTAAPDGAGVAERLTAYWRKALTGLPDECSLPGDRPRPVASRDGAHVAHHVDVALHEGLVNLAEREGTSLFMVLHAAVSALLSRGGAGDDIVLGTPVAGRSEPGLDDLIGLVTNTVVLRADTSGDPSFLDLLARVRLGDLAALDHQELPFDRLVEEINPPRLPGRHPLFQVMLALQNNAPAVLNLDGRQAPLRPVTSGTAKFDLFIDVRERYDPSGAPDGLDVHLEYATDLYEAITVQDFAHALSRLLHAVSTHPDMRLADLPAPQPREPAGSRSSGTPGLADAALSVPGIRDAVAVPGAEGGMPRLFVVPGRANATEGVERLLDRTGPEPVRVTAVNNLPRSPEGVLDVDGLGRLPLVDQMAAQAWSRHLTRVAGVAAADVVAEDIPEELGRRLARIPRRTAEPAPETHPRRVAGTRPALSEGPELTEPSVSGWAEALVRAAGRAQGEVVHVHPDGSETRRSYASLIPEASRVLAGLRRAGLRPGAPVILQCDDSQDFLAVLWGCILGGFVAVPLTVPTSYGVSSAALAKLEGIWRMLGRPLLVCSPALESGLRDVASRESWDGPRIVTADALRDAPEDRDWYAARPDDLILMLMTSGSTGLPKAVRLTHRGVLTRSAATEAVNGLDEADVTLNWIPLDHVTGVVMFHLRDVYLGCRQIHAPTSWILQDPLRWMDLAHRHRVTVTWAPNFAFGTLAQQARRFGDRDWDLTPMRLVMNAGEVVVAAAARSFLHALKPFGLPQDVMHPGWGMSETCSVVTDAVLSAQAPDTDETFISCGLPYPGFAMRIVGDGGTALAEEDIGRLQVRGTSVTGGYHDNPTANAEAFTDDGWFDTGDLAFLRGGELYITGRAKDVIIVNGVNHYSHEIEACVEQLPGVVRSFTAACAVRSDPSATTDELALFFHLAPGAERAATLREIAGKVTREIGVSPAFLIPVAPDIIPKTEIGKIQRSKLRNSFEAGDFDDAVREVQLLLGTAATVPDWFLRPVWTRAERHRPRISAAGRHTLVLAGGDPRGHDLAENLARSLRAGGDLCTVVTDAAAYQRLDAARYRIRYLEEADHARLLDALDDDQRRIDAVIHLGALSGAPHDEAYPDHTAAGLLMLVRALVARSDTTRPAELLYVTAGAQAVTGDDRPSPAQAVAGAILKSAEQESGRLRCVHLDLEAGAGDDPVPYADELVLLLEAEAEAAHAPADPEVAYRDGHRHVRRLAPSPEAPDRGRTSDAEGYHLISGGLGGVGAALAEHLLETSGTRLLILGRTPLPPEDSWERHLGDETREAARIEAYRRLRELGDVRYACADVTDEGRVRAAVDAAGQAWGVPLVSILHLAGAVVERPIDDLDAAAWDEVLDAKAHGAWVLHRISADHPVVSFILFSSVNGYFGGAMNTAYAAANAYLDALAGYRRALGLPAQSLAWSMWQDRGMSSGYQLTALTEARGYRILETTEALRSFELARTMDAPHVLIGADRTVPGVRSHVEEPTRHVRRLAGRVALKEGADLGALYRAAADATGGAPWVLRAAGSATEPAGGPDVQDRLRGVEDRLAGLWGGVLGRDRVGREENFFDLGGNSLLMITAQSAVNRAFGSDLSVVDLFAHPTVRDLARHLVSRADVPAAVAAVASGEPPSGLDRAMEQAERQRAARTRRSARQRKGPGHA